MTSVLDRRVRRSAARAVAGATTTSTRSTSAMNAGRLSRRQLQGWVANRFYYQISIPRKDAAILANCPDVEVRRRWIRRIVDHDGTGPGEGGIEAWLRLGEAVGLTREEMLAERHLVPGVRFAVDAYVTFARTRPWVEAVASSLTELFAPDLMAERLAAFERYYPWIDRRRPRLLPGPAAPGSPRLRARAGGRHPVLPDGRRAGPGGGRAVVQVRRAVERPGRHRPGLPGVIGRRRPAEAGAARPAALRRHAQPVRAARPGVGRRAQRDERGHPRAVRRAADRSPRSSPSCGAATTGWPTTRCARSVDRMAARHYVEISDG